MSNADPVGETTLENIGKADRFNRWMYDTIAPYCKGDILEIGSGIGNISKFFLDNSSNLFLSDLRASYCDKLGEKFKGHSNLLGIGEIDLVSPNFEENYKSKIGAFDTLFALNVIEHIEDHNQAIDNCHKLLKQGGNLIILVPSYQNLYNQFDVGLGHFRRYTKQTLRGIFNLNHFSLIHDQYFNAAGILGWYVSGKIQKNDAIPSGQMSLYNKLVPIFKFVDKAIFSSFGLSTIIVAKKK